MFKRIAVLALAVMLCGGVATAAEGDFINHINFTTVVDAVSSVRPGIGINVDGGVDVLTVFKAVEYKKFALEVGYATPSNRALAEHKGVLGLSYPIASLIEKGIDIPLLSKIDFDIIAYGSLKRIAIGRGNAKDNNEIGCGLGIIGEINF